jgi:hypothetical protein
LPVFEDTPDGAGKSSSIFDGSQNEEKLKGSGFNLTPGQKRNTSTTDL